MPELKEEKGDKVYWCVNVKWWDKVRSYNAWQQVERSNSIEQVYAASLTDVIVHMMSIPLEGRKGHFEPRADSASKILETTALWH